MTEEKQEGTLTVDVYFKDDNLVIVAPIAGASLDNIEILVDGDVLIIKGERMPPENIEPSLYEHQECFWGPFSRTIILPKDLDLENIRAYYHNGILMVKIPKKGKGGVKRIEIRTD
jgi:HSP20 family protein